MRTIPPPRLRRAAALAATVATASTLHGCGYSGRSTLLAGGPEPVRLTLRPATLAAGSRGVVAVSSPAADSIIFESANGLDRYSAPGPRLAVRLTGSFGDSMPRTRYAVRERGRLLDILRKPARVSVCRRNRCRTFDYAVPVRLPERNDRSFAITTGWSTAFTRRALVTASRSVLFRQALSNALWTAQAEFATPALSARAHGFYRADAYGGSLDLSRLVTGSQDGLNYGVAAHFDVTHDGWLRRENAPALGGHTVYQATIGPSVMLKGLTASSQFGVYTDGRETLQVLSTRLAVNGGLTDVRLPVSASAEKSFSFGGGGIVPRRRDAVERFTIGIQVVRDLGLKLGVSSHTSRWPPDAAGADLRAHELYLELGGEYTWGW